MMGLRDGLALCSLGASTPHLASPFRGGRDELGKEASVGLGAGFGEIPAASAGMTGAQGKGGNGIGGWSIAVPARGSHPPPNLPPQRGEG